MFEVSLQFGKSYFTFLCESILYELEVVAAFQFSVKTSLKGFVDIPRGLKKVFHGVVIRKLYIVEFSKCFENHITIRKIQLYQQGHFIRTFKTRKQTTTPLIK